MDLSLLLCLSAIHLISLGKNFYYRNFFSLPSGYPHPLVVNRRTGRPVTWLGPVYLHQRSKERNYTEFMACLEREIFNGKAFTCVTDNEVTNIKVSYRWPL